MDKWALMRGGAPLVAAIALGSCSGMSTNQSGPSAGAFTLEPGQYETTFRVKNASLDQLPQRMRDQMQQIQRGDQTTRGCMPVSFSIDLVRVQNMRFSFPVQRNGPTGNCALSEVTLDGGQLRGSARCEAANLPQQGDMPRALTLTGELTGDYQPNQLHFTGTGTITIPGENRQGNVEIEVTTRRTGECPAPLPIPPSSYGPPPTSSNTLDTMSGGPGGNGAPSGNWMDR